MRYLPVHNSSTEYIGTYLRRRGLGYLSANTNTKKIHPINFIIIFAVVTPPTWSTRTMIMFKKYPTMKSRLIRSHVVEEGRARERRDRRRKGEDGI